MVPHDVAKPYLFSVRIGVHRRLRMYRKFLRRPSHNQDDTILDLGATSDDSNDHSNYLVAWYPTSGKSRPSQTIAFIRKISVPA
jgi:hypothetical protein